VGIALLPFGGANQPGDHPGIPPFSPLGLPTKIGLDCQTIVLRSSGLEVRVFPGAPTTNHTKTLIWFAEFLTESFTSLDKRAPGSERGVVDLTTFSPSGRVLV
jgi:hypothetical protein